MPPYNKTAAPCKNFASGNCTRRNCPFSHATVGSKGNMVIAGGNILATVLKLLLEKAQNDVYVPEERRLIISKFKSSPDIQSMVSSIDFNTTSFCDALCSAIAEKLGPTGLVILDVSSNEIRTLTHLTNALKKHGLHTNLSALSVENNNVNSTDFTTSLQGFPNLQQLVMLGNPVASTADYRQMVRKRLPNLVGLDKQPIQRPPLGLPWPAKSTPALTETTASALNFVASYFDVINASGLDNVIEKYHPQAVFSFCFVNEQATVKWDGEPSNNTNSNNNNNTNSILGSPNRRPLPSKDVLRDVTVLRMKQSEGNHNVLKGLKGANIARGRAEVVSKLSHLIYQRAFTVEHTFNNSVNAMMLQGGKHVAVDMVVVTMHGYMRWRHTTAADVEFIRVFDRTMTLVPNPNPATAAITPLVIANDFIELRPTADDPLFFADNDARVAMIARKFNLLPPIVFACMTMCAMKYGGNDKTLFALLGEISNNVPMSLLEMIAVQIGTSDMPLVINTGRLMARKQMSDVMAAAEMVRAAGGDSDAIQ